MRFRFLLIVMLLFGNFARAQFQAQEGWGKPRLITSLSATGGLILDAKNDLVLALEETGLSQINLKTASKTVLIQKRGLKELRGLSSEWGIVGAWGQRSLSSDDSLQIFWLKNGKLEIETATTNGIPSAKTVLASATGPVAIWAESLGENTVIYVKAWRKKARVVYRSKLSVGALEASRASDETYSFLFAEGYRNAQDEKFDAVLLTGSLEKLTRKFLGPAVYARGGRYLLAQNGNNTIPVWWWETLEDQRIAALTKSHNPVLDDSSLFR